MNTQHTTRRWVARAGVFAGLLGCALVCGAQVSSYGDKEQGTNRGDELPKVLQGISVTQHLNQQLPLDAPFVDDTGKTVKLGDYFGTGANDRPAVLAMVYFTCTMLVLGRAGRLDGRAGDGEADSG